VVGAVTKGDAEFVANSIDVSGNIVLDGDCSSVGGVVGVGGTSAASFGSSPLVISRLRRSSTFRSGM